MGSFHAPRLAPSYLHIHVARKLTPPASLIHASLVILAQLFWHRHLPGLSALTIGYQRWSTAMMVLPGIGNRISAPPLTDGLSTDLHWPCGNECLSVDCECPYLCQLTGLPVGNECLSAITLKQFLLASISYWPPYENETVYGDLLDMTSCQLTVSRHCP